MHGSMRRCGRRRLCPLLRGLSFGLLLLPHLRALASEQLSAPLVSEDAVVLDALLEVCGMGVLVCVRARHDATCEVVAGQAWHPENWDPETPYCAWPGIKCVEVIVDGRSFFSGKQTRSAVQVSGCVLHACFPQAVTGSRHHNFQAITLRRVCEHVHSDEHVCEIPPVIGGLQYVESLYLAGNDFHGHIPGEIGKLKTLKHLFLNSNGLWGEIPLSIGNLLLLEKLHLNHNKLSGEIPVSLARATHLHQLELQDNELSGGLPPELGALAELVRVSVDWNISPCFSVYRCIRVSVNPFFSMCV